MDMSVILLLLGLAALAAWAYKRGQRPHYRESMQPWSINWSQGFPKSPAMTGSGWRIDFPADPSHHLNYVQWYKMPRLREGQTVSARIRVTGGPFVFLETPSQPPTITLLIQRKQDNMASPGYRYYSKATMPLAAGEYTMTVPLTIEHWGDVIAPADRTAFLRVLAEAESIGLIFGGPGGRGHGVSGTGSVELLSLEVQ